MNHKVQTQGKCISNNSFLGIGAALGATYLEYVKQLMKKSKQRTEKLRRNNRVVLVMRTLVDTLSFPSAY